MSSPRTAIAVLMTVALTGCAAQERADRGSSRETSREEKRDRIKPYDEVITKDAVTTEGVFTCHQVKDKILYEIPPSQLNKEFLWVTQIARTQATSTPGGGSASLPNHT